MPTYFSTEASLVSTMALPLEQSDGGCPGGLSLRGVKVLVVTSGHEVTDHRVYAKQAMSLGHSGADVTVIGALEHPVPGNVPVLAVSKSVSRLVRFVWQPWRCLWAARKLPAQIIHFHDPEMLVTLPIARLWWPRARFVYDVHEDFANLMLIRDWLPGWAKPAVKRLTDAVEKRLALLADAVVGVTPPLAAKFANKEKIVAYNYAPRQFFDESASFLVQPNKREIDLVHLGTLNLRRADFLIRVLEEFHRLRPGARSLIVGVAPEIEGAIRHRIPDGCALVGKIPHGQVPRLLGDAKVGLDVHPWLGAHLEVAVPVKVCEYMAAGCAVVTSHMPVLKRILDEAGVLPSDLSIINGGEPVDYARAVVQAIEMIGKGANPGVRLQKAALEHLVWEKEAVKIVQLYQRLLGRPCAA